MSYFLPNIVGGVSGVNAGIYTTHGVSGIYSLGSFELGASDGSL